jgi:hypothetical protein
MGDPGSLAPRATDHLSRAEIFQYPNLMLRPRLLGPETSSGLKAKALIESERRSVI